MPNAQLSNIPLVSRPALHSNITGSKPINQSLCHTADATTNNKAPSLAL
jgi:hypothetical protein